MYWPTRNQRVLSKMPPMIVESPVRSMEAHGMRTTAPMLLHGRSYSSASRPGQPRSTVHAWYECSFCHSEHNNFLSSSEAARTIPGASSLAIPGQLL